jgi:PAS domain S-box-containing protein
MLGYSRLELMSLPFPEITHPAELAEDLDKTGRLMRGEISMHVMEKRYLTKTGEWLWVHLTGSMVRDDSGAPLYFVAVIEDISDRRRALDKLKASEIELHNALNAKDLFLATVSHELRAPLSPILMLAEDAANDPLTPEFLRGAFETIAKSAEQQARIVDDLLDLSRSTAGTLACNLEMLELDLALDEAVTSVTPAAAERKIEISVERNGHRFVVRGDRGRLRQVFANLIGNAVKFSADGGAITVCVSTAYSSQACVEIRDAGLGMTAEELSRLFGKFTQGEQVRREAKRYGGLGLGLSISKTIMELHGGTISANSAGRGLGSIFKVTLPLV